MVVGVGVVLGVSEGVGVRKRCDNDCHPSFRRVHA
jgi:hypothetical protein